MLCVFVVKEKCEGDDWTSGGKQWAQRKTQQQKSRYVSSVNEKSVGIKVYFRQTKHTKHQVQNLLCNENKNIFNLHRCHIDFEKLHQI